MQREEFLATHWGEIRLVWSKEGISYLSLPAEKPGVCNRSLSGTARDVQRQLEEYFGGCRREFDLPVDLSQMTPFQQRVYKVVGGIPFGEVQSYLWVAGEAGCPKGQRAVGQAMGKNPVAILIP